MGVEAEETKFASVAEVFARLREELEEDFELPEAPRGIRPNALLEVLEELSGDAD